MSCPRLFAGLPGADPRKHDHIHMGCCDSGMRDSPSVRFMDSAPNPVPYTFKVPAPSLQTCRGTGCPKTSNGPSFSQQLDHTIAVVWCLFRKKSNLATGRECDLGVAQLQWARFFLTGLKSPSTGESTEEVNTATRAVENALLDLYGTMSELVIDKQRGRGAPFSPVSTPHLAKGTDSKHSSCKVCSTASLGVRGGVGRPRRSGTNRENFHSPSMCSTCRKGGHPQSPGMYQNQSYQTMSPMQRDPRLYAEIQDLRRTAFQLSQNGPGNSGQGQSSGVGGYNNSRRHRRGYDDYPDYKSKNCCPRAYSR